MQAFYSLALVHTILKELFDIRSGLGCTNQLDWSRELHQPSPSILDEILMVQTLKKRHIRIYKLVTNNKWPATGEIRVVQAGLDCLQILARSSWWCFGQSSFGLSKINLR